MNISAPHRLSGIRKLFLFAAPMALLAVSHAAIPPAEQLLPSDTLFVFSSPDCVKTADFYKKSVQSQFWNDPAMKPFHDKFVSKWKEEFVEPLERDLGVKLDSYTDLLQGQLTIAITQDGWNGRGEQVPAIVLLLDAKEKSRQLKTNLTELRKKWVDSGKTIRTEKIRDTEFSIVALSSNDIPKSLKSFFPQAAEVHELGEKPDNKPKQKSEIAIGQYESVLIVSSSTRAAEKVIARLTGGSVPALADEASFDANRVSLLRDSPLFAWFNAKRFFDVMASLPPEEPNPEAPSPLPQLPMDKILSAAGLTGLKTVAVTWHKLDEGSSIELFFGVPEASRTGIFKILAADAKDSSPPAFVPADVVKFQRWRIDGQKSITAMEKMIGEISPQGLRVWNFMLETAESGMQEKDPTYNIRKNFFGNLGDDIIGYQKAPRSTSAEDLESPPSIFLIGSPNADQLASAILGPLSIVSSRSAAPETREFRGKKIYTIPAIRPPMMMGGSPAPVGQKLNFAASSGYLALSSDVSMLEEFLRSNEGQSKALRELPGLSDAAAKVGGQNTGLFAYENQLEQMRNSFESLRLSSKPGTNNSAVDLNILAGSIPFMGPERSFKEWLDFSLLPQYDKVSKYFYFTVYSGSVSGDGVTWKFFAPTPPELRK